MKITTTTTTIDLTADDLKQIIEQLAPITNPVLHTLHYNKLPESAINKPKANPRNLIITAERMLKSIEDQKQKEQAKQEQAPAQEPKTQPKMEMPLPPKSTANKLKAVEQLKQEPKANPTSGRKQPGEAPVCVRTWSPEELNLLRTCPSDDSAKFVYASHFKDARSEGAVKQKWYKMNLAGDILRIGDAVHVDGENKQGIIQSFTDDHQCANIGYSGDPATYQTNISRIKKVNKE